VQFLGAKGNETPVEVPEDVGKVNKLSPDKIPF
jgi:hypothetical protein